MDKIVVVAGIWGMCALCAVLFIRGASARAGRQSRRPGRAPRKVIDGAAQ